MRLDFFRDRVIPVAWKLALRWLPCRASDVVGSVLVWLVRCRCAVAGWDGGLDLQLLSRCGGAWGCLSRSVACCWEQATNQQTNRAGDINVDSPFVEHLHSIPLSNFKVIQAHPTLRFRRPPPPFTCCRNKNRPPRMKVLRLLEMRDISRVCILT